MKDGKAKYVDFLTAEIFGALHKVIPDTTPSRLFNSAYEKIKSIIDREYVEIEDRAPPAAPRSRGPGSGTKLNNYKLTKKI